MLTAGDVQEHSIFPGNSDARKHWRNFWTIAFDPTASFVAALGQKWYLLTTHTVSGSHVHPRRGETPAVNHKQIRNKVAWDSFKLECLGITCYAGTSLAKDLGRTPILCGDFNLQDAQEQVETFLDNVSKKVCRNIIWRGRPLTWNSVARSGTFILSPDELLPWDNPHKIGKHNNVFGGYTAASDAHDPIGATVLNRAASSAAASTRQTNARSKHLVELAEEIWETAATAWSMVMQKRSFKEQHEAQLLKRQYMDDDEHDRDAEARRQRDAEGLAAVQRVQDSSSASVHITGSL